MSHEHQCSMSWGSGHGCRLEVGHGTPDHLCACGNRLEYPRPQAPKVDWWHKGWAALGMENTELQSRLDRRTAELDAQIVENQRLIAEINDLSQEVNRLRVGVHSDVDEHMQAFFTWNEKQRNNHLIDYHEQSVTAVVFSDRAERNKRHRQAHEREKVEHDAGDNAI